MELCVNGGGIVIHEARMPAKQGSRSPFEVCRVHVEALAHDGRGIAHRDGKAIFIDGALPGEDVSIGIHTRRSSYDEADVEQLINPSPHRFRSRVVHISVFAVDAFCSISIRMNS